LFGCWELFGGAGRGGRRGRGTGGASVLEEAAEFVVKDAFGLLFLGTVLMLFDGYGKLCEVS
jgi:hypothetical protein